MIDTHIDIGQILLLAGGGAAWVGSLYVQKARLEDLTKRQDNFEARVDVTLKEHGVVLFSMSGQLQRVIGTLTGAPVRHTDIPGAGN